MATPPALPAQLSRPDAQLVIDALNQRIGWNGSSTIDARNWVGNAPSASDVGPQLQKFLEALRDEGPGARGILPPWTVVTGEPLVSYSKVFLDGCGPASQIKLGDNSNCNVLTVLNYGSGGQDDYSFHNFSVNGNKANNASGGIGIASDGRKVRIDNVYAFNCKKEGILHEQTAADLPATEGGQDTLVSNFHVWNCDGFGVVNNAHDAQFLSGFTIQNAKGGMIGKTGPTVCYGVHSWGNQEYAYKANGVMICTDCEAEGAEKAEVWVGEEMQWTGGRVFEGGEAFGAVPGFEIGESGSVLRTEGTYITETRTAGGVKFTHEGSAATKVRCHFFDSKGGPAITGTPNPEANFDISLGGSSTMGIEAAPYHFNGNKVVLFGNGNFDLNEGRVKLSERFEAPSAAANTAKIYAVDNGAGKTQLMVRFGTGAAQQIAIEP